MLKTPLSTMIGGAGIWTPKAKILDETSNVFDQIIKPLFVNGEQGFAYELRDRNAIFQNAAGTTPITDTGQPVGLILDKSKGLSLGSELNPNITFETLNGWATGSATTAVIENSEARVTFGGKLASSANNWFGLNGTYKVGEVYTVSFDATYVSGGNLEIGFGYAVGFTVFGNLNGGVKTRYTFTAGGSFNAPALLAFAASSAGSVWKIDNVSVKKVSGNHAYQTTTSMRPLLVASPQRINFDTVDDKLITNLPAQLTGCTVIRSVPNVGTQILTGQTIPALYNDNTDHCGLIVINRDLTPDETSAITREFNKRAGV